MPYLQHLREEITYWAPNGTDTFGGTIFKEPRTLKVRWEDKVDLVRNKMGKEIVSKSRVFFAEPIEDTGYVFRGLSQADSPRDETGSLEIQAIGHVPDLRNVSQLYVAYL